MRNFDVPLMVILSGMSFAVAGMKGSYLDYVMSRFRRLVIPVWVFLSIFFSVAFFLGFKHELSTVLLSFGLISGIGYVWIIRIFFIMALLAPILAKLDGSIRSNNQFLVVVLLLFVVNEAVRYVSLDELDGVYLKLAMKSYLDILPYAILFLLGMRMSRLTKNQLLTVNLTSLFLFVIIMIPLAKMNGWNFVPTQEGKYPAGMYYLTYSLFIISLLWLGIKDANLRIGHIIGFISANTIWIYLWHIAVKFILINSSLELGWWLDYIIIYSAAVLLVWGQVCFVNLINDKIESPATTKNIAAIFTG
ncbi:acyltransferase family protein [Tolumonas auensis]|uniref:acyltransferase family protein n=1 Tax=Tolumonas auensis TaxID=43948 RepID=UPI002AA927E4|nr:acyltransferase family protein [Tolumonas auensis]